MSLADMDRYNAVTEYRFDCRTERDPSWEDMVFWRETGMKEEEEEVEAREGAWSIETAMVLKALTDPNRDFGQTERFGCEECCSRRSTSC